MSEKYIIREVPTVRYIGIERAARGLKVSASHLSMCLRGQRPLAKSKLARLQVIRINPEDGHGHNPAT